MTTKGHEGMETSCLVPSEPPTVVPVGYRVSRVASIGRATTSRARPSRPRPPQMSVPKGQSKNAPDFVACQRPRKEREHSPFPLGGGAKRTERSERARQVSVAGHAVAVLRT